MNKEQILKKAKYIQIPFLNRKYDGGYANEYKDINLIKMPCIIDTENILYDPKYSKSNGHHYTTFYHITYVLPILSQILNFRFSLNDFDIIPCIINHCDLSYLRPKKNFHYHVHCFTNNEEYDCNYEYLKPINDIDWDKNGYRMLYIYHHQCSQIINKDLHNGRKLFISGDSQTIPDILPLTCYFEEVWYFDNRTGKSDDWKTIDPEKTIKFADYYKDVEFTDVLIELYTNPLHWYTEINLM